MKIIKFIIFVLFLGGILLICPNVFGKNLAPTGSISFVDFNNNYDLRKGRKFNHISPCSYEENTIEDTIENLRHIYDGYNIYGTYDFECTINIKRASDIGGNHLITETLLISVNIKNSKIEDIIYKFGDNIFYRFVISEDHQDEYTPFEGFDLCNIYGEEVTATISYIEVFTSGIGPDKNAKSAASRCNYYLKINMMFISYSLVTNDNTINVDCNNPATEAEIVDSLGFTLPNGTVLSNYEIIGSNYNINDLEKKQYIISVRAVDDENKIYVKNIIVNVSDYNPIRNNTIMTPYYNKIDRNTIINALGIECGYKYIEVNTNYNDNYNICGEYNLRVKIITNSNDVYKRTGKIIVYDKVGPVIMGETDLYTDTEHRLSEKEIKSNYTVVDEYSNTGITLDVIEKNAPDNLYINNYNKAGNYYMNIEASDQYGNVTTKGIVLHVSQYQHYEPAITSSSSETSVPEVSSSAPSSTSSEPSSIPSSSSSYNYPAISTSYIPEISNSSEPMQSSSALPTTTSSVINNPSSSSNIPSTSVESSSIPSTSSEATSIATNITSTSLEPSSIPSTSPSHTTIPSSSTIPSTSVWTPVIITPSTTSRQVTPSTSSIPSSSEKAEESTLANTTPSTSAWIPIEFGTSSSSVIPSTTKTTDIPKVSSSTTPKTTTWIPIDFGASTKTTEAIVPSTTTIVEPSRTSISTSRTSVWVPLDLGTSVRSDVPDPTVIATTKEEPSTIPSTTIETNIPKTELSTEESSISTTEITTILSTDITNPTNNTTERLQEISSTAKSYIINTDTKTPLSIENIKRKLLNSGIISEEEYSSVVIESNYFNKTASEGYYIINIKHSDGSVDTCAIRVLAAQAESSDNNMIIMFAIIGSVSIVLFASIIIFIVRKRGKNNEKAN